MVFAPEGGYRSVALDAVGATDAGVKAGVNEKGLAIVSATAGQVPKSERAKFKQAGNLNRRILSSCATVEDVMGKLDLFRRPAFYMIADRCEIALIEVSPDGRPAVIRRRNGMVTHTNHYVALEPPTGTRAPGVSSSHRYQRIQELLSNPTRPFTIEDFVGFSADRTEGPNNSIWRTGRAEGRTRTLATWIVAVPPAGTPRLYVKTADPGQSERTCRISVETASGLRDNEQISLTEGLCSSSTPLKADELTNRRDGLQESK
jgi:hypothetical protein